MALPCVVRGLCKNILDTQLKSNAAILGSLHHYSSFRNQNHHNQLGIGLYNNQHPAREQLLSKICLQNVKNLSLSQQRLAGASHDHGKMWGAERIISASLMATVPLAFVFPSQAMDSIVALTMVLHSHWGLEACVVDYIRPNLFGPVVPKVAQGTLYVVSIATLAGLFYLIYNDMGLANAIIRFWKL